MQLNGIHHVAIICGDYARSKYFYSEILGFKVIAETYREARRSYKLDLLICDGTQIELFSFPSNPLRVDRPEARGLRHLAFKVPDIEAAISHLTRCGIVVEAIRVDELTGKRFAFFPDPDGLPLELCEV